MKTLKNLLILGAVLISNLAFSQGTETRKVSAFTKLSVEGSFDVILEKGNEESIKIVSENIDTKKILTDLKDGSLRIYTEKEDYENTIKNILKRGLDQVVRVKVYVIYKNLEKIGRAGSGNLSCNSDLALSSLNNSGSGNVNIKGSIKAPQTNVGLSGSGNVTLASIEADDLHLSVAGSGNIKVSAGSVKKQSLNIAGSGGINTSGLKSETCSASVAGSGDANVYANTTIEGSITGSGSINYKGDARITRNAVAGSGRIRKQG